jgi:hypothetical protein
VIVPYKQEIHADVEYLQSLKVYHFTHLTILYLELNLSTQACIKSSSIEHNESCNETSIVWS